jgi:hypothetical protein
LKKIFLFFKVDNIQGGIMPNFEEVRENLKEAIENNGFSCRDVSLRIGRKDSYIQQYIKYGFPKRLSEIDRKKVAELLKIDEELLIDDELMESKEEGLKKVLFEVIRDGKVIGELKVDVKQYEDVDILMRKK